MREFFSFKGKSGSGTYRYGFNGKENDNEVKGAGSQQDYGMRIYDPRLGRFLSVDPITARYPELTPYQFASNRPIDGIDRDGLEYCPTIPKFEIQGRSFSDYVKGIDNGVIDILNLVPAFYNGGVSTVLSLKRGTYGEDLRRDITQVGAGLKQTAIKIKEEPLKTLTSPQALEVLVSVYVGLKLLPTGNNGNMLTPPKTSVATTTTLATDKVVATGINGAKFTTSQLAKMLAPAEGDMMTLYRGMTGTEGGSGTLFLATTEEYAASYSTNVTSFQISRTGFKRLLNEGLVETKTGVNSTTGMQGAEIAVSNQAVKAEVLKNIKKP